MMKIEMNISSEYGIMFLHDSNVKPDLPMDVGKDPVMWTSTCLAFNVLIYVDGDAKIILCDCSSDMGYVEYFSGDIECPSKSISLSDHNGFVFVSLPLKDSFARLSLRMSECTNPDVVECSIENIDAF